MSTNTCTCNVYTMASRNAYRLICGRDVTAEQPVCEVADYIVVLAEQSGTGGKSRDCTG